jgi:hypothetical protein
MSLMRRLNRPGQDAGASWRRAAAAGAGSVLAAGIVLVAAGPAAAGKAPVLAFTSSPYHYGHVMNSQTVSKTFKLAISDRSASSRENALPAKGYGKGSGYCTGYSGGVTASYEFDDVYACQGTTTGATTFDNPGAGVYAWQCVELSARFLWAIYGVWAGPGSGVEDGADLVSVVHSNSPDIPVGTPGPGSVPTAGDVISLGPGGSVDAVDGHTGVVTSASPATGQFTVISENDNDTTGTAGEDTWEVDLSGSHNGYVELSGSGVWTPASWLETAAGIWGNAVQVPGTATLNAGEDAQIVSVSCSSAGNCGAGGSYTDASGIEQAFVVNETNGAWGDAEEVPGIASSTAGGNTYVGSVSCTSAGNCSAGGEYVDGSGNTQAFIVGETNGTWGTAEEVPGTATLNKGEDAYVNSVSCPSAGNCGADGDYTDAKGHDQVFVVNETNGTWGTAEEVPGTATLNKGGSAGTGEVSCASAGNCSDGGDYTDAKGHGQAFVVNETKGTWGTAKEVPGTATLNTGGQAWVSSVSCASAGNCSGGGSYKNGSGYQAFVVSEKNGAWGTAKEVPGTATLNKDGDASLQSISCAAVGDCSAGGGYTDSSGRGQAYVVAETNGTWGTAKEEPGTATLNKDGNAYVQAISCAAGGSCGAVGIYTDSQGDSQSFAASEVNGTWMTANKLPDINGLVESVSCATAAGYCSAGGSYLDNSGDTQAFVIDES